MPSTRRVVVEEWSLRVIRPRDLQGDFIRETPPRWEDPINLMVDGAASRIALGRYAAETGLAGLPNRAANKGKYTLSSQACKVR